MVENKARKGALVERAKDFLATQEYTEMRDQLDKSIIGLYTRQQKSQRKDHAKDSPTRERDRKKKRKPVEDEDDGDGKSKVPPCALGLGPDDENKLVVSDQMMELVRLRRNWVDSVGGILKKREMEMKGEDVEMLMADEDDGEDDDEDDLLRDDLAMDIG